MSSLGESPQSASRCDEVQRPDGEPDLAARAVAAPAADIMCCLRWSAVIVAAGHAIDPAEADPVAEARAAIHLPLAAAGDAIVGLARRLLPTGADAASARAAVRMPMRPPSRRHRTPSVPGPITEDVAVLITGLVHLHGAVGDGDGVGQHQSASVAAGRPNARSSVANPRHHSELSDDSVVRTHPFRAVRTHGHPAPLGIRGREAAQADVPPGLDVRESVSAVAAVDVGTFVPPHTSWATVAARVRRAASQASWGTDNVRVGTH